MIDDKMIPLMRRRLSEFDAAIARLSELDGEAFLRLTITDLSVPTLETIALPGLSDLQPILLERLRRDRESLEMAIAGMLEGAGA